MGKKKRGFYVDWALGIFELNDSHSAFISSYEAKGKDYSKRCRAKQLLCLCFQSRF